MYLKFRLCMVCMMNKTPVFLTTSSYLIIYISLIALYWSLLQDGSISINKLLPSHTYGLYHYTGPYYKMIVFQSTSSYLLIYMAYINLLVTNTR